MTKLLLVAATVLTLGAAPAFASSCTRHMAAIDAALAKNPTLSPQQMSEVKKLRGDGETMHKSGKHTESMDALAKAEKMLGIGK